MPRWSCGVDTAGGLAWSLVAGPDAVPDPPHGPVLDDAACAASVAVHSGRRQLVWFDSGLDPVQRRAVLAAMRHTWPGWDVRYGWDGQRDVYAFQRGTCTTTTGS